MKYYKENKKNEKGMSIMTKESYLQSLENLLKKHISKEEINDILRDYGEYFDDGRRQNKTDIEISAKLGDPEMIAQQFIEEIGKDNIKESKTEKIDQALHSIKEGTEKAFTTLNKDTSKTIHSASEKINTTRQYNKQNQFDIGGGVKKGTKTIFSVIRSIFTFCLFAFLQFFFTIFVYGFCISSSFFFVCCGIFGIFCLGFSLTFLPLILSLSIIFIIIASISLAILLILLTVYLLKKNWKIIKNIFMKNTVKEAI